MKNRLWILCIAALGAFSNPVHAEVNFDELMCNDSVPEKRIVAKVQESKLVFQYQSTSMHHLLEAIFPVGTPRELSGLYRCMELDFSIPSNHCTQKSKNLELIACKSENVKLKIIAKNSCYAPTKTKIYTGDAAVFAYETKKTNKKNGDHFLRHDWSFTIKGNSEVVNFTDGFIANFWDAESGVGRPACRVDDYVIDYRQ